jgi:hypothetical protein
LVAGRSYGVRCYGKALGTGATRWMAARIGLPGSTTQFVAVDLATGAVTTSTPVGVLIRDIQVQDAGSGWWLLTFVVYSPFSGASSWSFRGSNSATNTAPASYTGDGVSGLYAVMPYLWEIEGKNDAGIFNVVTDNVGFPNGTDGYYAAGAQFELGSVVTDYQGIGAVAAVNPDANPAECYPDEVWFVDRKAEESPLYLTFELATSFDVAGKMLPGRQFIPLCPYQYRGEGCGYTGVAVAKADDTPTSVMGQDDCGHRLSSCALRQWPDKVLNFGGFPAVGLIR